MYVIEAEGEKDSVGGTACRIAGVSPSLRIMRYNVTLTIEATARALLKSII